MKKEVKRLFSDIENEFDRYVSTVNDIFADYRKQVDAAKALCARYKDESGELKKSKDGLIPAARREIEKADRELHDHVAKYCDALRVALSEYVCTAASPAIVQALRNYKDFGLEPSRMEVDSLLLQADGNYQAFRLIQAVTTKYRLTFPVAEDYESDLVRVERETRTPILYVPEGHTRDGLEILPNARRYLPNGASYDIGRPEALHIAMRTGEIQSFHEALPAMAEKWGTAVVPDVADFEPIETEKGDVISPARQHHEAAQAAAEGVGVSEEDGTVALAHRLGQQRAAQAATRVTQ